MSKVFQQQYSDAKGTLISKPGIGIVLCAGTEVPTDGAAGYSTGCMFVHTDGGNNAALYVNEGTATSADFNVADISANTVTLTAAGTVLTSADSGKTYFINNATGFVAATLPAPTAGCRFTFINITANTSGNHTVVTGSSANVIKGNQNSVAGDAGDSGTADDTISFVANQSVAGDKVELYSDGTSWFAYAISRVAAGITFTQAS